MDVGDPPLRKATELYHMIKKYGIIVTQKVYVIEGTPRTKFLRKITQCMGYY